MSIDLLELKLYNISEEELQKQFKEFNKKIAEESETCCDEWREQIWK